MGFYLITRYCVIVFIGIYLFYRFHKSAPKNDPELIEKDGMKWVRLKDDRILEYGECGDISGTIMINTHSYGFSGHFFISPYLCNLAERHGIRLISVTYPCFGRSDCYPLDTVRKISEWPTDVEQVLQHLQVPKTESFYLSGESFGCVHAAVVAAAVPHRVLGVLLFTPTMPAALEKQENVNTAWITTLVRGMLATTYVGDVVAEVLGKADPLIKFNAVPDCKRAVERMETLGGEWADIRRRIIEDSSRALINSNRGLADNAKTITGPWDFNLTAVGDVVTKFNKKVLITTCPEDSTNPPQMQNWVYKNIPGSTLVTVPDSWGHLHFVVEEFWEELVSFMIGEKEDLSYESI